MVAKAAEAPEVPHWVSVVWAVVLWLMNPWRMLLMLSKVVAASFKDINLCKKRKASKNPTEEKILVRKEN